MSERRIETYEEFWPFYVREHSDKTNRRLHFVGTSGTLLFTLAAVVRRKPVHLLHALVSGYGGAWIGHYFFQKNTPATFKYPLWSLISDFKMYAKIVAGRMDAEVERAFDEEQARKAHEEQAPASDGPAADVNPAPQPRPEDLN